MAKKLKLEVETGYKIYYNVMHDYLCGHTNSKKEIIKTYDFKPLKENYDGKLLKDKQWAAKDLDKIGGTKYESLPLLGAGTYSNSFSEVSLIAGNMIAYRINDHQSCGKNGVLRKGVITKVEEDYNKVFLGHKGGSLYVKYIRKYFVRRLLKNDKLTNIFEEHTFKMEKNIKVDLDLLDKNAEKYCMMLEITPFMLELPKMSMYDKKEPKLTKEHVLRCQEYNSIYDEMRKLYISERKARKENKG